MAEAAMKDDDDVIESTAVEVDDDSEEETRTNVRDDDSDDDSGSSKSGDDELASYSESVQRRINQLTAKRKQASEEAAAAYQYAEQVRQENEQMRARLQQVSTGYNREAEGRLAAQEQQAIRAYAEANEAGDYERAAKAQQALAKIAVAKDRVRAQKGELERQAQQYQAQLEAQRQQQQYYQQQAPQQQAPQRQRDEKLEGWLEKNSWFGKDRLMTRAAQAIHEQLVLEEDFDPRSDDYYREIDARMRREMPHKFKNTRSNAQTVASASVGRTQKTGRKKSVELTPGQVAFAKKMRIPLEKYAQEVAKIQNRRE